MQEQEEIVKIKEEKLDDRNEALASSLPLPILVKVEAKTDDADETSINPNLVEIKKENGETLNSGITSPAHPEANNLLDFLNELDDVIPIVPKTEIIHIDDDDDDTDAKKDKQEAESSEHKSEKQKKKHKKKDKKRRSSRSPEDTKRKIKKEKEVALESEKDVSTEKLPAKVFNYNHSSVAQVSKSDNETESHIYSKDVKSENEELKLPLPKKIKLEKEISSLPKSTNGISVPKSESDRSNENEAFTRRKKSSSSYELEKGNERESMQLPLPKKIKLEEKTHSSEKNKIRLDQVMKNCKKALKHFQISKSTPHLYRFLYVPTKLINPKNQSKEYRSPLLRSNNISYGFSSTNANASYSQPDVECPSETVTKVSKLIGLNVTILRDWMNNFNNNASDNNAKENNKPFAKAKNFGTFCSSISTQTVDVPCDKCLLRSVKPKCDAASEAIPDVNEVATQTREQAELPIMKMLETLNANQLLAVNDFSMLMCEQNWDTADANSRLNIRNKLVQCFEDGQKPCNVAGMMRSQNNQAIHKINELPARGITNPVLPPMTSGSIQSVYNPSGVPMNHHFTQQPPTAQIPYQYQFHQPQPQTNYPNLTEMYAQPPQMHMIQNSTPQIMPHNVGYAPAYQMNRIPNGPAEMSAKDPRLHRNMQNNRMLR